MVQTQKKIALLHRYPKDRIRETNSAFPYLEKNDIDILTFKTFDRISNRKKFIKSLIWIFYAPLLVIGKKYDVIYCDDSFPFYPYLVKMVSPKSKVIIRLGDLHLMYYTEGWKYKVLHHFEMWAWRKADKILAISEAMQDYLLSDGFQSEVVLDPIEPADFMPNKELMTQTEPIVMFHGLLTKNKNIDLVIVAAIRMPDVWFWIVGDGPDLARLRKIAPRNVVFTGWHDYKHVAALINNCNVGLALRSNNQGNQYVVTSPFLQYGAMGKPCLVTRREVFGNYPWQFSDVNEMVKKIKILLKRPDEGIKLRHFVLRKHNAKKIGGKIWQHLLA
jgi:glycosyltransferase involved in cell wall biosynthesis